MKAVRNVLGVIGALAVIITMLGLFVPKSVIAQTVRAALVQDVDNSARHAVQVEKFVIGQVNPGVLVYTVPANNRLVIQTMSFSCVGGASGTPAVRLTTREEFFYNLQPWLDSSDFALTEQLTAYSEPGADVFVNFHNITGNCGVTMSGYLISLP
jgi:hypothetical protein